MLYNIFIDSQLNKNNFFNVDEITVNYIVTKIKSETNSFQLKGKYHFIGNLKTILIYENSKNLSEKDIINLARIDNEYYETLLGDYVSDLFLSKLGNDITNKFFSKSNELQTNNFINPDRIDALKKIKGNVDLSKLIRLCEELNINYTNQNYYSVAMLGRAIIDHIPPIFGMKSFNEVANNYGSKSISKTLQHLNNSMRNISDGMLHSHIRRVESLPNETQVNFSQDFDVLLGEIILQFSKV